MQNRRNTGSNLFMIELMMAIFFFAIVAAICTQIFSESYKMSGSSKRLTDEVNIASNIAEFTSNWDGSSETLENYFDVTAKNGVYTIYYNEDGSRASIDNAMYKAHIWTEEDSNTSTAKIAVGQINDENTIYYESLSTLDTWYCLTTTTLKR